MYSSQSSSQNLIMILSDTLVGGCVCMHTRLHSLDLLHFVILFSLLIDGTINYSLRSIGNEDIKPV
jgi:hypothetical protein